ncbi:MAG: uroporphyrinogen decarboxylase family protein [bacterium]
MGFEYLNFFPDYEGFLRCIRREDTPKRPHLIELCLDMEIQDAFCTRFGLANTLNPDDPFFHLKKQIKLQCFLGYDYILAGVEDIEFSYKKNLTTDTALLQKKDGRDFIDEQQGPITTWAEFEKYPWPDPRNAQVRALEWYNKNLPDNMLIVGGLTAHIAENLMFLMGYETLCIALFENRELVRAISERIMEIYRFEVETLLSFDRVKIIWASDDMGFKTGPLISPDDLKEFVFPAHKELAEITHNKKSLYLFHSCGKLDLIMDDLINYVKIDAKHSFEDTIENVADVKKKYGDKIALLGGIDVDFLCRSNENQIRERVRNTLEKCLPGGGYCLGTGNTVANYIPVENYLFMLDEAKRFS